MTASKSTKTEFIKNAGAVASGKQNTRARRKFSDASSYTNCFIRYSQRKAEAEAEAKAKAEVGVEAETEAEAEAEADSEAKAGTEAKALARETPWRATRLCP